MYVYIGALKVSDTDAYQTTSQSRPFTCLFQGTFSEIQLPALSARPEQFSSLL